MNDPGDPDKHWEALIPGMTSWKPEELEAFMKDTGFSDVKIIKNKFKFIVMGTK